jgi:hypothetical protein
MLLGYIFLGVAALVVVGGVTCRLAGVPMVTLAKILLTILAVCFGAAGVLVLTGDALQSAGYLGQGRIEPKKPAEPTPLVELIEVTEEQQLGWMHQHTVGVFIEGQGFGTGRMLHLDLGDVIAKPSSLSGNQDVVAGPFAGEGGKGPVHHGVQETMANGWMGRIRTKEGDEMWKVRQVHLVGLVTHPGPVVYLTEKVPKMTQPKDVPTRELDAFETKGLELLRGGQKLSIEKGDKEMRVLGPIYAGNSCVKCHEQKGQLLGAFTYRLERVPVKED